ncbi:hypothetical protein [Methylibium rhizosphaerae]|uniref:hypothetical protein n=1 Tax=Methylibium rhizosphaerae TaxID=2570323 RepID=UPI00112B7827|nr:hypothetical protein [Methylibium rhizosphaerae]
MWQPRRPGSWRFGIAAFAMFMSACGGGIYVGGYWDYDDWPPDVSIAVNPGSAAPGQQVALVAAASDADSGVDVVMFFRIESGGGITRLATDCCSPYEWTTTVPASATGSVRYFARAFDFAGNVADSAPVTVTVLP